MHKCSYPNLYIKEQKAKEELKHGEDIATAYTGKEDVAYCIRWYI